MIGKTDTGNNRRRLKERIVRLRANAIEIRCNQTTYIGGLIAAAEQDSMTREWVIQLDQKLHQFFAAAQFTRVDWAVRHALDGQPLAQWLHGFYSSHAEPFPLKIATLHRLCGSEAALRRFRQTLANALAALAAASEGHGEGFEFVIRGDLVYVRKTARGAQRRHPLGRQPTGSRLPS